MRKYHLVCPACGEHWEENVMSDDLLKRLETGHDKECAMSYGMHEHCCDCSYTVRQEAAARVRELEAERDALRERIVGMEEGRRLAGGSSHD